MPPFFLCLPLTKTVSSTHHPHFQFSSLAHNCLFEVFFILFKTLEEMDPRWWRGHLTSQSFSLPLCALPLSFSALELSLSLVMFSIGWSLVLPGRLSETTKFRFPGRKSNLRSHYFQGTCRNYLLWFWPSTKQK